MQTITSGTRLLFFLLTFQLFLFSFSRLFRDGKVSHRRRIRAVVHEKGTARLLFPMSSSLYGNLASKVGVNVEKCTSFGTSPEMPIDVHQRDQ